MGMFQPSHHSLTEYVSSVFCWAGKETHHARHTVPFAASCFINLLTHQEGMLSSNSGLAMLRCVWHIDHTKTRLHRTIGNLCPTSSIHFCDRKPQKSLRKRTGIGDKHREKTLSQYRKLQVWVSWVMLRSDVMICQNACNVCQN